MQQSCKWCGRIHPLGYICPMKPQPHKKNTRAQKFRNTYEWRKCREDVNSRDLHLCRLCLQEGKINRDNLETHHIIPLESSMDFATDPDWLITLCEEHHKAADRGEYDREDLHQLAMKEPELIGTK